MLNWFARRLKEAQEKDKTGQGGFTLIELLVVVIIIGILAAIAIPVFLNQRTNAQNRAAQAQLSSAATAQSISNTTASTFETDVTAVAGANNDLTDYGFRQGTPAVTSVSADTDSFCMSATSESSTVYYVSDVNTVPSTTVCT